MMMPSTVGSSSRSEPSGTPFTPNKTKAARTRQEREQRADRAGGAGRQAQQRLKHFGRDDDDHGEPPQCGSNYFLTAGRDSSQPMTPAPQGAASAGCAGACGTECGCSPRAS